MKHYCFLTGILCLVMILAPLACLGTESDNNKAHGYSAEKYTLTLLQSVSGRVVEIDMKNYIIGAVAAEMPASYHEEALRAQAVVCYTYAKWIKENADNPEESKTYDISDDSTVHQGYMTDEQMKAKWGDKYESYKNKIENAVLSVLGECITYDGEPILAVFHAISPGKTLPSETIWGDALPYLQSVNAPGDILSPDYDSSAEYTQDELIESFGLKDKNNNLISNFRQDENGFVTDITLGNKSFNGKEIASLLKLRSPVFTAEYKQGKYIFNVIGYGHGVGMSQYSADYMARQGFTYKEILTHFYKGTRIDNII